MTGGIKGKGILILDSIWLDNYLNMSIKTIWIINYFDLYSKENKDYKKIKYILIVYLLKVA